MANAERALANKIKRVYAQAATEITQKLRDFRKFHEIINNKMLADLQAGIITKRDYQGWLRGQVFTGTRWQQKLDDVTKVYVNADIKARDIINDIRKNVFVDFANQTAKDIQHDLRGSISFDLYDRTTVERLLKDNPKLLPEWKIDQPKDYTWNEKRVQNIVTQGIIQGESVYDIAKRLSTELATSNTKKMIMFARTAITGAENAGRIERMYETIDMGIDVRKRWMTVGDERVRDAHDDLDGVDVPVDEPFENEFGAIMYPGDPGAAPENVYNCRCTLGYIYPKYSHRGGD